MDVNANVSAKVNVIVNVNKDVIVRASGTKLLTCVAQQRLGGLSQTARWSCAAGQ